MATQNDIVLGAIVGAGRDGIEFAAVCTAAGIRPSTLHKRLWELAQRGHLIGRLILRRRVRLFYGIASPQLEREHVFNAISAHQFGVSLDRLERECGIYAERMRRHLSAMESSGRIESNDVLPHRRWGVIGSRARAEIKHAGSKRKDDIARQRNSRLWDSGGEFRQVLVAATAAKPLRKTGPASVWEFGQ